MGKKVCAVTWTSVLCFTRMAARRASRYSQTCGPVRLSDWAFLFVVGEQQFGATREYQRLSNPGRIGHGRALMWANPGGPMPQARPKHFIRFRRFHSAKSAGLCFLPALRHPGAHQQVFQLFLCELAVTAKRTIPKNTTFSRLVWPRRRGRPAIRVSNSSRS